MTHETTAKLILTAVMLLLIIIAASIQAKMEAKTYNRITGANVSAWEAIWVNLRVDTPAREARSND